ncbi:MAG: glycoside hydrolase family 3 C-terminal domain-containing protein, partial [Myxococcales bacterium]|nr:glycoside hydrolase family 3 C-terminal domain-containing protein [Myxococcales bacterium]
AWGRAQETYGEDTVHIGAMGVAFIEGAQEHVLASAKHFAANSIEDTRFDVNVTIDERSLREVYLPHFRRAVVDARVASVMSAYNSVNGRFCSENPALLRDILKGEWAFDGFVESDWVFGVRSTAAAANAGLDIEMPAGSFFGLLLADAVRAGEVDESVIDEAVGRILRKKVEYAEKLEPVLDPAAVESTEHVALAREVARESIVLLKNDPVGPSGPPLPLATGGGPIVVVGELAAIANLGDTGSSSVTPSEAVDPLAGITARTDREVIHIPGPTLDATDLATIAAADAAIVVVGLTTQQEGEGAISEGGDRETLALPAEQDALVGDVAATATPTIVVLEGGSAIVVRPWIDDVDALLMAWYPGMQGGHAIADVLFGDVAPSGRLPISFPRAEADLPPFDHTSLEVEYGFLHGYRYLDANGSQPELPFGFGLSYTTFGYDGLVVEPSAIDASGELRIAIDITNEGDRDADEVVQLYVRKDVSDYERAPRDLRAFRRVHLAAGDTKTVELTLPVGELAVYDVS